MNCRAGGFKGLVGLDPFECSSGVNRFAIALYVATSQVEAGLPANAGKRKC